MAGGSGTRFWPASRRQRPKQLLALTGERSLIQQTVDRMEPLTPADRVIIVTGASHAGALGEQLGQLPEGRIIAEPMARNTAAAAGLAAAWVAARDPEAVCLVLPADHLITDEALFLSTMRRAVRAAREEDVLVTLGLTPRFPATGFGYIETGPVKDNTSPQVCEVAAFHEKPELAKAREYLDSGRHLWNSGMFAWRAEVLLAEIRTHLPELADGLAELVLHLGAPDQAEALKRIYPQLPATSVDYGILEKSGNMRVVRGDFGWSDVGSWDAMAELWQADETGNAAQDGRMMAIEAEGNLVSAQGRLAAFLGVSGLVAVVTDDVLMVLPRDRCQDVKKFVDQLKEQGLEQYL